MASGDSASGVGPSVTTFPREGSGVPLSVPAPVRLCACLPLRLSARSLPLDPWADDRRLLAGAEEEHDTAVGA